MAVAGLANSDIVFDIGLYSTSQLAGENGGDGAVRVVFCAVFGNRPDHTVPEMMRYKLTGI